jgi:flagellar biosynthesis repressor protein FlbT
MNGRLKIHLKANERIFINGGALKVDRKVAIELLNDVVFLLDAHVMTEDEATTPLRQLYLAVQSMMLEPQGTAHLRSAFDQLLRTLAGSADSDRIRGALVEVKDLVERQRSYEALKRIKVLFELESVE